MTVRRFEPADSPQICEVFYRSVHEVASAKYDGAQVDAWAPKVPQPERWLPRLSEYETFVTDSSFGTLSDAERETSARLLSKVLDARREN